MAVIDRFTVTFSEDLNPATVNNLANYDLRGAGRGVRDVFSARTPTHGRPREGRVHRLDHGVRLGRRRQIQRCVRERIKRLGHPDEVRRRLRGDGDRGTARASLWGREDEIGSGGGGESRCCGALGLGGSAGGAGGGGGGVWMGAGGEVGEGRAAA